MLPDQEDGMRLLLNGEELETELAGEPTLGATLSVVQEHHIEGDHVISAVVLDGEPLTAEQLSAWKDRPVSEFGEARIEAPHRRELASYGLRLLARGLAESNAEREGIVDGFCQGRHGGAVELLVGYLQVWDTTQQTLASVTRMVEIDEAWELKGETVGSPEQTAERIKDLSEQLRQLKGALEAQDWVLLSDLLEYEFGPLTVDWQKMLEHLADDLDGQDTL